jgi:DNA-binding XRE family transcriptional regulator
MKTTKPRFADSRVKRKQIKHVSRGRRLTAAEARRYRALRAKLDQEIPLILAEHRAEQEMARVLDQLKHARESQGLSLADVRKRTGMDRSAISKLENGRRDNPTFDTLARYAAAVGKRLVITLADDTR